MVPAGRKMLSEQEAARYSRQMMLPGWGEEGQKRLKAARVAVAGAGGLGSAVLLYLAAAGVGSIRVIDNDALSVSNLNRQVLYTATDVGKTKAVLAAERLKKLNPWIDVEPVSCTITDENATDLVSDCIIVDALDNLPSRRLLNRVALMKKTPLFHGAVYGLEGRATTIIPERTVCLNCLYREVVPGKIPVVGVTPAIIGSIQAAEVIKYVVGIGDLLVNRLLMYDGNTMQFFEARLKRDPQCEDCGTGIKA